MVQVRSFDSCNEARATRWPAVLAMLWLATATAAGGCGADGPAATFGAASAAATATPGATFAAAGLANSAIAGGNAHTCAVVSGGVQCWGKNDRGQLGDGSSVTQSFQRVVVAGLAAVQAVTAGGAHSCAIAGGGARCWGANDRGELGNATPQNPGPPDSHVPVAVTNLASGLQAIAAGDQHTCAIVNGSARCWGANDFGQIGNADPGNQDASSPVGVAGLTGGVQAIAAGGSHSCAIVNGSARCWGFNGLGALGNATQDNPQPATAIRRSRSPA